MTAIAVPVVSALSNLFSSHASFPNGNPTTLKQFAEMGKSVAGQFTQWPGTADQALNVLQQIANGGVVSDPTFMAYIHQPTGTVINWGDPDPGRTAERSYAGQLVAGLAGTVQGHPNATQLSGILNGNVIAAGGSVPSVNPNFSVGDSLSAIVRAGLGAAEQEAGTRLAVAGGAAAQAGAAQRRNAQLLPGLSTTTIAIGVLVVVVVLFLVARRR